MSQPFKPQTRTTDAVIGDELVRLSQLGSVGATPSFIGGGYQANGPLSADAFVHLINVIASPIEARNQDPFPNGCTLRRMIINVVSNDRDADTTWRVRVGGVDGNETVTITNSTTGIFQDTTNTDVIASGDLVGYKFVVAGTTGSLTVKSAMIEVIPT